MPRQTSSSPTCLDHSNQDLNKELPQPPSRIHFARHSLVSLYYHRLRKLQGYHFGVFCCAGIAAAVLVVNLILTTWAVAKYGVHDGLGTLQDGSCKRTASLTFWIHLAINVLSTLLLGASNYSMQCLSSPTRSEVDKAHSQGIWLDIGVPSVRNLRRLSTTRIVLWWLLAISSIPLHLLYNSAVFSTLSSQRIGVYTVTSDFLDGAPFSGGAGPVAYYPSLLPAQDLQDPPDVPQDTLRDFVQDYKTNHSVVKLENKECVDTYSAPIITTNSDLVLVTDIDSHQNYNDSLVWEHQNLYSPLFYYGVSILCFPAWCTGPEAVSLQNLSIGMEDGTIASVDYCVSRVVREHCKLQFSVTIMIVVIVCNMIKTVCMLMISWKQDPEPLVTLGDAIASFLDRPDVTTERNCIAGRTKFEATIYWGLLLSRWHPEHLRWFRAASRKRWIVCNVL